MTLFESHEPARELCINGEGVVQRRRPACQTRMVEVVVNQVVSSAVRVAFLPDSRRADANRCSSGSKSRLAGGHR